MNRPRLMPASTPDHMAPAWLSCLHWAIGDEQVRAEFAFDTGVSWSLPKSGMDRAIDEATGADRDFIEKFVAWFNEFIWGEVGEEDR